MWEKNLALDAETAIWSGSRETYWLRPRQSKYTLYASLETTANSVDYFEDVFPAALDRVREYSISLSRN